MPRNIIYSVWSFGIQSTIRSLTILPCGRYSEGIMILYTTNTFQFSDHTLFTSFCTLPPPRCLEAIRFLEVCWKLRYDGEEGDRRFWEFLLDLPNLHELFIPITAVSVTLILPNLFRCLDPVDMLVCKRPMLEKLRVVVPYRYFEVSDQRNNEIQDTIKAAELIRKVRRVVSDASSKQRSYLVESRTSYLNYTNQLWV